MKKLFLSLFLAVLGFATMAQNITITHNVKDKNGKMSMLVTVDYRAPRSCNADLNLYVCDMNGQNVVANINGYKDAGGHLCSYLLNTPVVGGNGYTGKFYFPYEVLKRALRNGRWQVWFYMSDRQSNREILRSRNFPFTLSLN